jgi:hypothetical protein
MRRCVLPARFPLPSLHPLPLPPLRPPLAPPHPAPGPVPILVCPVEGPGPAPNEYRPRRTAGGARASMAGMGPGASFGGALRVAFKRCGPGVESPGPVKYAPPIDVTGLRRVGGRRRKGGSASGGESDDEDEGAAGMLGESFRVREHGGDGEGPAAGEGGGDTGSPDSAQGKGKGKVRGSASGDAPPPSGPTRKDSCTTTRKV